MRFCWNCGSQVEDSIKFCDKCGANMAAASQPPAGQPAPMPADISKQEQPTNVAPVIYPREAPRAKAPKGSGSGGNILMYSITAILVVALIALGVFYGQGVGKLNNANTQITGLTANVTSLQSQLATEKANVTTLQTQLAAETAIAADLQTQLTAAKGQVTSLTADLATAKGQVTSLTADLATANGKVTSLTADLATANGKVTTTQASLDKATADLAAATATNTTLQAQLTAIQAKYPLKDFPNYATLSTWVSAHVQPYSYTNGIWYSHALKMQSLAAEDGYYVSACVTPSAWSNDGYTNVYNSALVAGIIYLFDPEDSTSIYQYLAWGR
jgi:hypothetical protein